ncbi:hypothetical protein [Prauserella flavalba]|uniref:Secreted protein n=1 Tax=Prauserella flavalba TaxID=1477506 RepID=A0A318LG89_9PSEU|nr:hypothetical protein [Prauserella flavalba]PXY24068.1 hypothetical protein BA062_27845 [Prauserella flavalba]
MTVRRWVPGSLLAAVLVLGACGGDGGSDTGPPATTQTPATTQPTRPADACEGVVSAGQDVVSTAGRFLSGSATANDVRASVSALSGEIDSVRNTVGPEARAHLDEAKSALDRLGTALTAQPPDVSGVRSAANDALTALKQAATVCRSGSATPSS